MRSKLTNAGVDVQIGKSNVALVPNESFDLQEVNKIVNFYGYLKDEIDNVNVIDHLNYVRSLIHHIKDNK